MKAWKTHVETVRKRTKLAAGSTRWTKTMTKVNDDNLVSEINDLGDEADSADDRCTATEYARNEPAWMLDRVKRKVIVGVGCGTDSKPEHVLSDIRTYFDGADTYGAAPTADCPSVSTRSTASTAPPRSWSPPAAPDTTPPAARPRRLTP